MYDWQKFPGGMQAATPAPPSLYALTASPLQNGGAITSAPNCRLHVIAYL